MKQEAVVASYLALGDLQRERLRSEMRDVSQERLWQRPAPDKWSAGEHLDHTARLNAFFRRAFRVAWIALWPLARVRRSRSFDADIDDVYEREGMPLNVGWMWPPRHDASKPISPETLFDRLATEHARIGDFFSARDEHMLGNLPLYDPLIGWLNLVQALRVGVYHDEHHYRIVRRLLDLPECSSAGLPQPVRPDRS